MKKDLPKRVDQPVFGENPSVAGVAELARTRRKPTGEVKHAMIYEPSTGAVAGKGAMVFVEDRAVDPEAFVKMYFEGFRQTAGLSKTAMSVFEVVFHQLQGKKNQDRVFLNAATSGLSVSVFSRGLRELIERGFLFRSPYAESYWVNIRYIFNGDRLDFVKTYRREPRAARRADPAQPDMFSSSTAPENA